MTTLMKIQNVMIIDDETVDQMLYQRIIRRSQVIENAIPFQMAEDALAYLKSDECPPIDVIFLDVNMPRMNGFEFLEAATQELGSRLDDIMVMMVTTSLNPEDERKARAFSAVKDFITKPLTTQHLDDVAQLLEHRRR